MITSIEPKAVQTGEIVAEKLGIHCEIAAGLHEHEREKGEITSREEFQSTVINLFNHPDALVFGKETANQALKRFSNAVETIMTSYPCKTIAITSHGTVMALFYGKISGADPVEFWQKLGLPAFYVVAWPEYQVISESLTSETF